VTKFSRNAYRARPKPEPTPPRTPAEGLLTPEEFSDLRKPTHAPRCGRPRPPTRTRRYALLLWVQHRVASRQFRENERLFEDAL
jgi:hypothetical protein